MIPHLLGSSEQALPVLAGLFMGALCLGTALDIPYLTIVRKWTFRFPFFQNPTPSLMVGVTSIVGGTVLGRVRWGTPLKKALGLLASSILLLMLSAAFPSVWGSRNYRLSVEAALKRVYQALGKEYRDPRVEEAVRKIIEEKNRTVEEKDRALQPRDPVVRDFTVQLAKDHPGAYDDPQGSRVPTEAGLKQLYRIHQFVSSQWKYVSDPNVNWFDYASPARRTLAVGLAGDCDDYAVLLASLFDAIGARVRILHGYAPPMGHAWTEVFLGRGTQGERNLNRLKIILGSSVKAIEYQRETDGSIWLITDWSFGKLSIDPQRMEVAWQGD